MKRGPRWTIHADDDKALVLPLVGYLKPGQGLHRNVLFDQLIVQPLMVSFYFPP